MKKFYKPLRLTIVALAVSALLIVYVSALYRLQLSGAGEAEDAWIPADTTSRLVTLTARRGDILDRNGRLLVSSRPTYNVALSREALLAGGDTNGAITQLIHAALQAGVTYNDTFPVTIGAPFSYVPEMTTSQRDRLDAYFEFFKDQIDPGISASELIVWMKNHYGLDYTTSLADTRLIIGLRYELEIRAILGNVPTYIFASDVDTEFLAYIAEQSIPGVYTETGSARVYHTEYAAHLLGYTGSMSPEEYETEYKALDYALNAVVGQSGVEKAFEAYLHGTDGLQRIRTTKTGMVVDVETLVEPVPGQNVYLTIDIDLQASAEQALASQIAEINAGRVAEDRVPGGAVAVSDPNTGEMLAIASYPTFDITSFRKNYTELADDPDQPLLNRATQGKYNPGSTFKMVTAYAALSSGRFSRWTTINDTGRFTKYESPQPVCWIYSLTGHGHGPLDMVSALKHSCNYYFYQVGDTLADSASACAEALADAASAFGLGHQTGLEIAEIAGDLATPAFKKERLNEGWWRADTLFTAIGQGHNSFTPIQLCNYTATIANGGTRYALTLLHSVRSADYADTIHDTQPKALEALSNTDAVYVLQEGMRAVTGEGGTAYSTFGQSAVKVAAKTGTAQSGSTSLNNGVFVCYAPAYSPELSISVVVEKGGSGGAIMGIGRDIIDAYFTGDEAATMPDEGILLP